MSNSANTQVNETNKAEEKKEPIRINVEEHLKFSPNTECKFINTIELEQIVDGVFGPVFRDYIGCKISLNAGSLTNPNIPLNELYVTIYLAERKNDAPMTNVVRRINKGHSKFESLMKMSGSDAGRMYEVTPETYEALDEFRFFPAQKVNANFWAAMTTEMTYTLGYTASYNQEIVACVTGLSLDAILNKAYGNRTEEGVFQYQAKAVQIVANASGEYLVQITKLDVNKLEDLRRQLGGPIQRTEFHQYVR